MFSTDLAQKLIKLPKEIDGNVAVISLIDEKTRFVLKSVDEPEFSFLLEVSSNKKITFKISLHNQEDNTKEGLIRIDYKGGHKNPEEISPLVPEIALPYAGYWFQNEPHIHLYVEGFKDLAWAVPLGAYGFPVLEISSPSDFSDAILAFTKVVNITSTFNNICNIMSSWINGLINDYYVWLKSKTIVLADEETGWASIQTPFIGLFNDTIEIYAQKKQNKIILSDNGETIHNLDLVGTTFNRSAERKGIAERILLNYGIQLKENELFAEATEHNFPQKKHNFLSAIIELNDLYVLSKQNISSIFKEDVRTYLDNQNVIYTPDFISKGATGLEFMFDFQIAGRNNELVLKSFNTINKQTLSSFLFSWYDIKPIREKISKKNVTAIAILNDEEKPVKQEFLDALKTKQANFILWSERNTEENIAKLQAA